MKLSVKASVLLAMLMFAVIAVISYFFMRSQQQSLRAVIQKELEADVNTLAYVVRNFAEASRRNTAEIAAFLPMDAFRDRKSVV